MLAMPPPPVPQIVTTMRDTRVPVPLFSIDVATFIPSPVTCGEELVTPVRLETPFPTTSNHNRNQGASSGSGMYRFTFAIDPAGRPRAIRRVTDTSPPAFYGDTSDLAPALAASRFGAGAPRQACSISYRIATEPVAVAPIRSVYELASLPARQTAVAGIADRLRPPGSDCAYGPDGPYSINYPPFDTIAQEPGTLSWSFLAFDVDAKGRVRNAHVLGSSGNPVLDRASVKALSANRYAPGKGRTGCTFHYFRVGAQDAEESGLPADVPAETAGADCRIDRKTIPALFDGSAYPVAFRRRRIEGVAALSYDTAPWGAIGNIKVIASEPAEAFGQAARNALTGATVAGNETGHRGCILHVRFRMPEPGGAGRSPARSNPPIYQPSPVT